MLNQSGLLQSNTVFNSGLFTFSQLIGASACRNKCLQILAESTSSHQVDETQDSKINYDECVPLPAPIRNTLPPFTP